MVKKQITIVQGIVFAFALLVLASPLVFKIVDLDSSPKTAMIFAAILVIVSAIDPLTIKNLGWKKSPDGNEFGVSRHIPTESEVKFALSRDMADPEKKISDEPLVEAALQRSDDVKSATDFLLAATNAWKGKQCGEGLRLAYAGLALNPSDQRVKASLESRIGTLLWDVGNTDLAIDQYKKAMQTDSTYSMPHNNLGILLDEQGKPAAAETEYRKAIELDTENAIAHNSLGFLLYSQDKFAEAEAEAEYRKAIELDPGYVLAHNNLGRLLKGQGNVAEGEKHLAIAKGLGQGE